MPQKDPAARTEYLHQWYLKNAAQHKKNVLTRRKRVRQEFLKWKATLACMQCGENEPDCLEFHHVDFTAKDFDITRLTKSGWPLARIQAHLLEKCVVVCANCHRKIHKRIREMARENPSLPVPHRP